jgi:hypothetical protein
VDEAVELPASAFPSRERAGDESHHDSTPLTLRAETPEATTSEAEPKEETTAAADAAEEKKPETGEKKDMDAALPRAKKIEFPPSARSRARGSSPVSEKSTLPAPPEATQSRSPSSSQGMSGVRIAAYIVGSAVLSFGAVTAIRSFTGGEPPEETAPAAVASAIPAAVPAPTPKPVQKAKVQPKTEDLGLPPGVPLSNDKGLLEIDIGEKHAIYVDGTFVGRGPMRRVPLGAGNHEVVLKTPDGEIPLRASVQVGRRTRVSLPPPAQ